MRPPGGRSAAPLYRIRVVATALATEGVGLMQRRSPWG